MQVDNRELRFNNGYINKDNVELIFKYLDTELEEIVYKKYIIAIDMNKTFNWHIEQIELEPDKYDTEKQEEVVNEWEIRIY